MASFTERMMGAAKLNLSTYEEVEADKTATGQAIGVVVLSSVATGIGGAGMEGVGGMVGGAIGALIGWAFWAWLTYFIGTRILPTPQTHADWGELARVLGFAQSPGLLRILGVVPVLGPLVLLVTGLWTFVAVVIAVRQALDYSSTLRAVGVCIIGWVVQGLLIFFMGFFLPGGHSSF
ncbi:MAG: YIP1 family protein [Firmicutes bacterium]|nr:YIP1 family protein [Bacillota bacterium]